MATPTVDELLREAKQVASREMQPKPTLEEAAGDDDNHRYNLSQWRNERNENRARWLARRCAAAEADLARLVEAVEVAMFPFQMKPGSRVFKHTNDLCRILREIKEKRDG